MSSRGWISLHRRIQDHWLWDDKPFSKGQAWIDLLMMANYKENKFLLGNELIEVEEGSFITSEVKLSTRWGWSRTKVRGFLKLLEDDYMIVKKTDNKKTTLTIVNYTDYQIQETAEEHQKNIRKTSKEQRKNTTNKENKDNKDNNTCARYPEDNQYFQIALYLRKKIAEVNPNMKLPKDDPISLDKWSDDVRKIIELDKRTLDEFREIVKFVFDKSDFWNTVIQSPSGLRRNWDKITPQMNRVPRNNSKVISFKEQMDVLEEWANDE